MTYAPNNAPLSTVNRVFVCFKNPHLQNARFSSKDKRKQRKSSTSVRNFNFGIENIKIFATSLLIHGAFLEALKQKLEPVEHIQGNIGTIF